jgi:hypothetical protein
MKTFKEFISEDFDRDKLKKTLDDLADKWNKEPIKKAPKIPDGTGKTDYEDKEIESNPVRARFNRLRNAQRMIKLTTQK